MKNLCLVLTVICLLLSGVVRPVWSTTLPVGVLRFVQSVDKQVKVREDGLIALSNGAIYLPVLPQDPTVDLNPSKIERQWLGKDNKPDLIQFNNNLFLMRFTKGSRGKLITAKLNYPIELKEGLLPQDLKLPSNVVMPAELKVILGSINYTNRQANDTPDWVDTSVPVYQPGTASNGVVPNNVSHVLPANQLYLADATTQQLVAMNLATGQTISKTDLGCMPSAMTPTPGGLLALITCLNANQFVVADPITQQVRSQFATGQRPSALMVVNEATIWVANRFDKFLNVYPLIPVLKETGDKTDEENRLTVENEQLAMPTAADMLLQGNQPEQLLAIESASGSVHVVNTASKQLVQSLKTQPALSGAALTGNQLWVISRASTMVKAYDLKTGQEVHAVNVGKKPLSIVAGDKLYVLCAEDHRVEVIDPVAGTVLTTVALPEDSFPNNLVWNGRQLFAASPSLGEVYVINLDSYRVEAIWPGKATVLSFNVPAQPFQLEPITTLAIIEKTPPSSQLPHNQPKPSDLKSSDRPGMANAATPAKRNPDASQAASNPAAKKGVFSKLGNFFKL
jgi:hypothetical protein